MLQKRTRPSPTFTSRIHPSVRRSGFVTYSGLGSPKLRVKRNVNTPRIPYKYTKEQRWSTFFTNGRPHFHKMCMLMCDVVYELGGDIFWEESHSHLPGAHAEVRALRRIDRKEKSRNSYASVVFLYLSYSPCANCADSILEFSRSRPHCTVYIRFSCLFRHEEELHRDGFWSGYSQFYRKGGEFFHHKSHYQLVKKNSAPFIMFAGQEWRHLAEATGMPFRCVAPARDAWDSKWKTIFESVLADKNQPTHFVPSQERKYTPVMMIPSTPVPTERQVIGPGAGRSRAYSQGVSSWTQRQSTEEDREVLLDATTIQIPQNQPTRFVPSQERECTPVMTIPATPVLSEHQVTAPGAGWSSDCSRGVASRTQQQIIGEGREVVLDVTRIEIPQNQPTHFVPSQERKCTPAIMIPVTPVPPERQVIGPGAGRSRAYSRGVSSWTQRQSTEEDREVLLDATTIQIPQVDESVAEHAEGRTKIPVVCCVAVILGIILTLAITLPVVFA